MGRYGITIKNPTFEGIGISWTSDISNINEYLMLEKAKLGAFALKEKSEQYININPLSFILRSIKQYLIILSVKKYESWVENDELYLNDVSQFKSKLEYEDDVKLFESFIDNDIEGLAIYALLPPNIILYDEKEYRKELTDVVDCVRCDIDNIIKNMQESVDTYVEYMIALKNYDNIVKEKELTREDIEND